MSLQFILKSPFCFMQMNLRTKKAEGQMGCLNCFFEKLLFSKIIWGIIPPLKSNIDSYMQCHLDMWLQYCNSWDFAHA